MARPDAHVRRRARLRLHNGRRPIGGNGRAEVFSFHATKFFNTLEGGAVVTDDDDLAARAS